MFKNYLKIALRNLKRDKIYSFINIFGLATGIACCLLILLYINDELSFDGFHKNADRIYRVNTDLKFGSTELALQVCSDMMGPIMKKDYPQIENYVRLFTYSSIQVKKGNNYNNEYNIAFADSTFFEVFTFPAIAGNTDHILNEPNTVVISKSIAEKYFGSVDAIGKFIETNDDGGTPYKITAVIQDMPENSHFRFDFIFPMENLKYDWGNYVSMNFRTYFLLKKGVKPAEFEKKFVEYNDNYVFPFAKKFMNIESKEAFKKAGNRIEHSLINLKDIHLYSKRQQEISPGGSIEYIYIFSAIALFILVIACVNFTNLTTARSANRAREVGIRKVLGTERKSLVSQFLLESTTMVFLSIILAVVISYLVLPFFNSIAEKNLKLTSMLSPGFVIFLLVLPFIVGVIAGSYPAFFLSRFMPSEIIKGKLSAGSKSGFLRSSLVVFQFATSIILITGTLIIYSQLNYMRTKDPGYNKDQLLIINDAYNLNNIQAFKNEMLDSPDVISATVSGYLPIPSQRNFNAVFTNPLMGTDNGLTMQQWRIDYDYFNTYGMKVKSGRNFSRDFGTDSTAAILNETAVRQLGFSDPLGKKIYTMNDGVLKTYTIIGVIHDFNYESLKQNIGPLSFFLGKNYGSITLKVKTADFSGLISRAETLWKKYAAGKQFGYRFADDSFDQIYRADKRVGTIALSFALLAIIVAGLGLFGLATFLAEQRTKEIGIRKVLGASVASLLFMLSKEFMKWILIANLIAWPFAYYFMEKWLQDYAYRININWWIFVLTGTISLFIALLTVSFQAVKASTANPVESLRYE